MANLTQKSSLCPRFAAEKILGRICFAERSNFTPICASEYLNQKRAHPLQSCSDICLHFIDLS